jgi:hypothetical protein
VAGHQLTLLVRDNKLWEEMPAAREQAADHTIDKHVDECREVPERAHSEGEAA